MRQSAQPPTLAKGGLVTGDAGISLLRLRCQFLRTHLAVERLGFLHTDQAVMVRVQEAEAFDRQMRAQKIAAKPK